jgi:glycosyltransferase involved in cell wall biosynthesis
MKISGCIIAKNEEGNITQCINNLKFVSDEIIVVDTGSEDNTIRIAEKLGAMVYKQYWENDFSKAKNTALSYAKSDWIIFLDADEYFREDSLPKIRQIIENEHPNQSVEGIFCEMIHIDKDTGELISNDEILRMFRNSSQIRYINKVHEEIRNNGEMLKCISVNDTVTIMHTGYSASLHKNKAKRNLELMLDNTEDELASYYFASTYFILCDYESAYKYADLALSINAVSERDWLAYKMHLIKISVAMTVDYADRTKVKKLIEEANQKYGYHPEIVRIEADYLFKEKIFDNALDKYLYALDCQIKYGSTFVRNDFTGSIHEVYLNIAHIFNAMNKEADALSYYVKALQSNRYHSKSFDCMIAICRPYPETETIALINSIYDVEKKEDVEFIIAHIADCGRPKIVLYYASKWNKTFGQEDDALIFAFISLGDYLHALEIAQLYLKVDKEKYSSLVTAIIIMGQLFSEAEKVKGKIGADYFNIIICYAESRKYSGNSDVFIAVFARLIKHIGQFNIADYLKIGIESGAYIVRNIAEIFLADFQFDKAIYYFNMLFKLQEAEDEKAVAAFETGYCFYKLKQFQESLSWFEKAILNGCAENGLAEYLRWIGKQASDDEIKRKAETMRERVV